MKTLMPQAQSASLDSAERMVYHRLKREKIYPKSRKNDNPGNGAKNDNPGNGAKNDNPGFTD